MDIIIIVTSIYVVFMLVFSYENIRNRIKCRFENQRSFESRAISLLRESRDIEQMSPGLEMTLVKKNWVVKRDLLLSQKNKQEAKLLEENENVRFLKAK